MKIFGQNQSPNRISRVCRCWIPHFFAVVLQFWAHSTWIRGGDQKPRNPTNKMSRAPDNWWSLECYRARLNSDSSESSNQESAESDSSSVMSVQVLDQAECDDPSCVEHGMGDSPDEENVEISNNNGNVSIKSHEKLFIESIRRKSKSS